MEQMKKILGVALAGLLLVPAVGTAASARPWTNHGGYGYRGGDHTGAYVAAGLGIFALAAILASQHHDRYADRYDDRYDYRPPPPLPPRNGYGPGADRDYDGTYGR
jgi:hypothetical protein